MDLFKLFSNHSLARCFSGFAPMSSLVCSNEDDGGDGGDGGTGDQGDGGDDEDQGDKAKGAAPSKEPSKDGDVVTMSRADYDKEIERARNAGAAKVRKRQQQKQKQPNPQPDDGASDLLSKVGELIDQKFESLQTSLTAKESRAEYEKMMSSYDINPELSALLYDSFQANKPKEPEKWIVERLSAIGAKVPKELRKQVNLAAVGPKGVRELDMVESIFDLTDEERAILGPSGVRKIFDRQNKQGAAASPFIRQKAKG